MFKKGDIVRSPGGKLYGVSHYEHAGRLWVIPVTPSGNIDRRQYGRGMSVDGVVLVRRQWLCPERGEYGCDKPLRWVREWTADEGEYGTNHYDVFKCPTCRTKFVSRNSGEPEVTTDRTV